MEESRSRAGQAGTASSAAVGARRLLAGQRADAVADARGAHGLGHAGGGPLVAGADGLDVVGSAGRAAMARMSGSVSLPSSRSPSSALPVARGIAVVVEHVVDELEGDADARAELAERAPPPRAGAPADATRRRGRPTRRATPSCPGRRGSTPPRATSRRRAAAELHDLAVDQAPQRREEVAEHGRRGATAAVRSSAWVEQQVAREHAHGVAPDARGASGAAALLPVVDRRRRGAASRGGRAPRRRRRRAPPAGTGPKHAAERSTVSGRTRLPPASSRCVAESVAGETPSRVSRASSRRRPPGRRPAARGPGRCARRPAPRPARRWPPRAAGRRRRRGVRRGVHEVALGFKMI